MTPTLLSGNDSATVSKFSVSPVRPVNKLRLAEIVPLTSLILEACGLPNAPCDYAQHERNGDQTDGSCVRCHALDKLFATGKLFDWSFIHDGQNARA